MTHPAEPGSATLRFRASELERSARELREMADRQDLEMASQTIVDGKLYESYVGLPASAADRTDAELGARADFCLWSDKPFTTREVEGEEIEYSTIGAHRFVVRILPGSEPELRYPEPGVLDSRWEVELAVGKGVLIPEGARLFVHGRSWSFNPNHKRS